MTTPIILGGAIIVLILMSLGKGKASAATPAALPKPAATVIPSPWSDVTGAAWTKFVKVIAGNRPFSYASTNNFFGAFGFGVRRLCDIGIMKDPKKSSPTVWTGTWVTPKATFLGSPTVQYNALAKSMVSYRTAVIGKTDVKKVIGTTIEGKKATLSGLLAVAHMAGGNGMVSWLADPTARQKRTYVTTAYKNATGIF